MQQLMRLMAAGLAQEFLVELGNIRVLVALADGCIGVLGIECLSTLLLQIHTHLHFGRNDRLATAGDTATGARHNFDEVIVRLAVANALQQLEIYRDVYMSQTKGGVSNE